MLSDGRLALIPLFIGFAIDGLLAGQLAALLQLIGVMTALIVISVIRRAYDTRVFGTVRVALGASQTVRAPDLPVSTQNARLGMGRELVDFLEVDLPQAMAALVQLVISVIVLASYAPALGLAAAGALIAMMMIYALFHRHFYRLNGQLNLQAERQVGILASCDPRRLLAHLSRLRGIEVRISDAESILYGMIFVVLLGLVVFNLWYATLTLAFTPGSIFSIISYSWEFVEAALALPMTLQGWSRLSEIIDRINQPTQVNTAQPDD